MCVVSHEVAAPVVGGAGGGGRLMGKFSRARGSKEG